VNRLRAIAAELDIGLVDHAPVWYRDGSDVRSVSRAEFRKLAADGDVDPDVGVFDTTMTSLRQLRQDGLERPATATWHGASFFKARATG
jgi:hypothetical protein